MTNKTKEIKRYNDVRDGYFLEVEEEVVIRKEFRLGRNDKSDFIMRGEILQDDEITEEEWISKNIDEYISDLEVEILIQESIPAYEADVAEYLRIQAILDE